MSRTGKCTGGTDDLGYLCLCGSRDVGSWGPDQILGKMAFTWEKVSSRMRVCIWSVGGFGLVQIKSKDMESMPSL